MCVFECRCKKNADLVVETDKKRIEEREKVIKSTTCIRNIELNIIS